MNVRLKYDMTWRAGIWFEGRLQMNVYSITLDLLTATSVQEDHIVCINRLNHFVYNELDSTVFINQEDTQALQNLTQAGIKVTTLPEQPIDQIIGLVLYSKINAFMEGNMVVTAIEISSELGDNIRYLHSENEQIKINFGPGWWEDSAPAHSNFKPRGTKNVVKLTRTPQWNDLGLAWSANIEEQIDNGNTVVFPSFTKDED